MCLRQDPHRSLCPELQRRYKCFQVPALWFAYLRFQRASVMAHLLLKIDSGTRRRGVQSRKPFSICMYIPLHSSQIPSFCVWRPTAYCIGVPFDLHIPSEHCGLVNDVTHIPAPATQSEITQEFTTFDAPSLSPSESALRL